MAEFGSCNRTRTPVTLQHKNLKQAMHKEILTNLNDVKQCCKERWAKTLPQQCKTWIMSFRKQLLHAIAGKNGSNYWIMTYMKLPTCALAGFTTIKPITPGMHRTVQEQQDGKIWNWIGMWKTKLLYYYFSVVCLLNIFLHRHTWFSFTVHNCLHVKATESSGSVLKI